MSTLLRRQMLFSRLVVRLIDRAHQLGFDVTLGETYRPAETVELYAWQGRGTRGSLHPLRLAIDLHLFRNGVFLTRSEDHEPLGHYWKTLHMDARWGGDFRPKVDGNHYSLDWEGRA